MRRLRRVMQLIEGETVDSLDAFAIEEDVPGLLNRGPCRAT